MHRLIRELRLREFDRAVELGHTVVLPRRLEGKFDFDPFVRVLYIEGIDNAFVHSVRRPTRVFPLEGLWDED